MKDLRNIDSGLSLLSDLSDDNFTNVWLYGNQKYDYHINHFDAHHETYLRFTKVQMKVFLIYADLLFYDT